MGNHTMLLEDKPFPSYKRTYTEETDLIDLEQLNFKLKRGVWRNDGGKPP